MSSELFGAAESDESRSQRIRRLVEEVRQRRLRGEPITNEAVVREHPDLMPELAESLNTLRLLEAARAEAKEHDANVQGIGSVASHSTDRNLSVRCPHCRSSMQIQDNSKLVDIECDSCQQRFHLADDDNRRFPELNCTLGHLVLVERLGSGGFGVVWKARDTELDRMVAVKIPRQSHHSSDDTETFLHEARTIAQLNHPNIVRLYEVGRDGDTVYIVSDIVEGTTLEEWILKRTPSYRQAAVMCQTIAHALQYAHENGVIHRDLKPTNVLVDEQNTPHLLDFGLARRDACQTTVTADGQVLGTPAYMSPEQARGHSHQADQRSDIYSLGVVLFEILTGERPFRGSPHLLVQQVINAEPPQLRKINSSVPRDLETICLKCLEKDPDNRYQSAQLFADDLGRFLRHEPVQARPLAATTRALRLCRRNFALASLAATLVVVVVVALASVTALWLKAAKEVRNTQWFRYRTDMRAALSAWEAGNVDRCVKYLDGHRESEWRGFEWYYLRHLCQDNAPRLQFQSGGLAQICYSPNGATLATSPRDKLSLWDPSTGKNFDTVPAHSSAIPGLAYSPDGITLATSCLDGSVKLWKQSSGGKLTFQRELVPATDSSRAMCVAFSRTGKTLAAAVGKNIKLWTTDGFTPLPELEGHTDEVLYVAFSPTEESLLASASRDRTVRLWNITRSEAAPPLRHERAVWEVVFSPDGKMLASAGDSSIVRLWNVSTQQEARKLAGHTGTIQSLAFSPNGNWLASGSWDRTLRVWNLPSPTIHPHVLKGFDGFATVAFSPDGKMLATNGLYGMVKLYDFPIADTTDNLPGQYIAFSKDKSRLLTVSWDRSSRLWECDDDFAEIPFKLPVSLGRRWSFSSDFSRLANISASGTVEVWDLYSNRARPLAMEDAQNVERVLLSPDGGTLAVAAGECVRLWDLETFTVSATDIHVFRESHGAYAMTFSPDGQYFLSSRELNPVNEYQLELRDLHGELITHSDPHEYPFLVMAFSDDGQTVASGSYNQITLWNLESNQHARLVGTEVVHCLAFDPAGKRLASAGMDGNITLWDTSTGDEVLTLSGHSRRVVSLAFSRDSEVLASSSENQVRIWRAPRAIH